VLQRTLGAALGLAFARIPAWAADDPRQLRPHKGDLLVYALGERAGQVIVPADLPRGGPQQLAFPMDPRTKIVRDGSLLNQVALVRLDAAQLSAETREFAADGVVAYSAVCTHHGCPISMWHSESKTLFCSCHASRFDPADRARVIDGPAPRRLPILPLESGGRGVVVADGFSARVGPQTQ
jgi:rieske iron-sulfur protein